MSTLAEIEAAADQLPPEELRMLLSQVANRLEQVGGTGAPGPRIAGRHAGTIEMAPDFDDPLPDEFWLGKDA